MCITNPSPRIDISVLNHDRGASRAHGSHFLWKQEKRLQCLLLTNINHVEHAGLLPHLTADLTDQLEQRRDLIMCSILYLSADCSQPKALMIPALSNVPYVPPYQVTECEYTDLRP